MKRLLFFSILLMLIAAPVLAVGGITVSTGCDAQGNALPVMGVPVIFIHTEKQTLIPGVHCDPADSDADPVHIDGILKEGILPSGSGETINVDRLISNNTTIFYPDLPNGGLKYYDLKISLSTAICDGIYERVNYYRAEKSRDPLAYNLGIETAAQGVADGVSEIPGTTTGLNTATTTANPNDATYIIGKDVGFHVVDEWMEDLQAKENILNINYTKIGLGIKLNGTVATSDYFIIALFGDPVGEVEELIVKPDLEPAVAPVKTVAPIVAPQTSFSGTSIVNAVVYYTNLERTAAGLEPLTQDTKLNAVAQGHSNDMKADGYFSHTAPDGTALIDRLKSAGYVYSTAGENIAKSNYYTASSNTSKVGEYFVELWMNSAGHRANILNANFTQIGIGVAYDSTNGYILTMDLAAPPKVSDLVSEYLFPAPVATPKPTPVQTPVPTPKPTTVPATIPTTAPTTIPTTVPTLAPTPVPTVVPAPVITPVPTPTAPTESVFVPEPTFATHLQPYIAEGANTNLFYNLNNVMSVFSWW